MATCRFLLGNLAESATVLNGSAGSPTPPARSEVTPFVMERALNDDRRSLWKLGALNDTVYGGTGYQIDLGFGSGVSVSAIALHGLSCPGGFIDEVSVGYANSYPTSSYVQKDAIVTTGLSPRDVGFTWTIQSKQYWWIYVAATAAPIIGRVKVGALVDLGVAPNPGSTSSPFRNRLEQVLEDGSVILNEVGYPGRDITLNFSPITAATAALIETVQQYSGPVTYFDQDNNCFECIVKGARVELASVGGGLLSAQLSLMRLP